MYPLLDTIDDPADVKRLSYTQLVKLATEVRQRILEVVAAKGGYLAAGLGPLSWRLPQAKKRKGRVANVHLTMPDALDDNSKRAGDSLCN